MTKRWIITGGPGSGKSTLLSYLAEQGWATSMEAGRAIIQAQQALQGDALPWVNPLKFAEHMLTWEIYSYQLAQGNCLFDRGIPDILGYLRLSQIDIPEIFWQAAKQYSYQRKVFIAPPWQQIYQQDSERKQDFALAVATFESMQQIYTELGYTLIELPKVSIAQRAAFVKQYVLSDLQI